MRANAIALIQNDNVARTAASYIAEFEVADSTQDRLKLVPFQTAMTLSNAKEGGANQSEIEPDTFCRDRYWPNRVISSHAIHVHGSSAIRSTTESVAEMAI